MARPNVYPKSIKNLSKNKRDKLYGLVNSGIDPETAYHRVVTLGEFDQEIKERSKHNLIIGQRNRRQREYNERTHINIYYVDNDDDLEYIVSSDATPYDEVLADPNNKYY